MLHRSGSKASRTIISISLLLGLNSCLPDNSSPPTSPSSQTSASPQSTESPAEPEPSSTPDTAVLPSVQPVPSPTSSPSPPQASPSTLPSPQPSLEVPAPSPTPKPEVEAVILGQLPTSLSVGATPLRLSGTVRYTDGSEGPGVAVNMSKNPFARLEGYQLIPLAAGEVTLKFYALARPGVQAEVRLKITTDLVEDVISDEFQLVDLSGDFSVLHGDSSRLFVADRNKAQVHIVRLKTGELLRSLSVCQDPSRLKVDAQEQELYVICAQSSQVMHFDLSDYSALEPLELPEAVHDLLATSKRLYLSYDNSFFEPIDILNRSSGQELEDFPAEISGRTDLILSADQRFIYALNTEIRPVELFKVNILLDIPSLHAQKTQGALGTSLDAFHYAPNGNYIYYTPSDERFVYELNAHNLDDLGKFISLNRVRAIAATKDQDYVLVASAGQRLEIFARESRERLEIRSLSGEVHTLWLTPNQQSLYALMEKSSGYLHLEKIMDLVDLPELPD